MIPIEDKRLDWNTIRAEYIGGASYGDLSKKYHLSKSTIYQHAKLDNWQALREKATNAARTKTIQKTAEAAANNATLAADLKGRLLMRLKRIEEKYPMDATEIRTKIGNSYAIFRIKDLTAAYKDLADDLVKVDITSDAGGGNSLIAAIEHAARICGQVTDTPENADADSGDANEE